MNSLRVLAANPEGGVEQAAEFLQLFWIVIAQRHQSDQVSPNKKTGARPEAHFFFFAAGFARARRARWLALRALAAFGALALALEDASFAGRAARLLGAPRFGGSASASPASSETSSVSSPSEGNSRSALNRASPRSRASSSPSATGRLNSSAVRLGRSRPGGKRSRSMASSASQSVTPSDAAISETSRCRALSYNSRSLVGNGRSSERTCSPLTTSARPMIPPELIRSRLVRARCFQSRFARSLS